MFWIEVHLVVEVLEFKRSLHLLSCFIEVRFFTWHGYFDFSMADHYSATSIMMSREWSFVDIGCLIFREQDYACFDLSVEQLPKKHALS